MKKIFLFILLLTQIWASDKVSMAVYDFDASGISQDIASSVADFVQDGLMQTGRFTLVERKDVQRILKEQMFQKTGCTSTECAVEVGKMLNVSTIIKGKVSQMGTRTVISISLVDVEAGKIVLTDSVECGSVELLNTGSKRLAEHFSRGVAVRGKILKITAGDAIINLGMDDGIKNGDILNVERYGDAVKDDAGKIVFQEKTNVGALKVKDASSSGSKAEMVDGRDNIKTGDIVELKIEKLRALDPILTSADTSAPEPYTSAIKKKSRFSAIDSQTPAYEPEPIITKPANPNDEMRFGFFFNYEFSGTLYYKTKPVGGTVSVQVPLRTFDNHWAMGIEFGNNMAEYLEMGNNVAFIFPPSFKDLAGVEDTTKSAFLMTDGIYLKIYPFVGLLNPQFSKEKIILKQRGDFQPYIGVIGQAYLGIFEPNLSSTSTNSIFLFGLGLELRAGLEFFNSVYAEFMWRVLSTPAGETTSKITGTQYYTLDLNTTAVRVGLRF